ncbi:MAG: lysophospholipid acyltransferase family protein [Candidatus Aminicenantaceae bacterium]
MTLGQRVRLFLIGSIGKLVYRLWMWSARTTVVGEEPYKQLRDQNKPVILMIWHGRLFITPYFFRNRGIMPMISPSGDGELLVKLASGWGYKFLRGSGSHSMLRAWAILKKELAAGGEVVIVPDGPKGPGKQVKPGALKLSQVSGAPIVPFSFSAARRKILGSWDEFLLPWPFQRLVAIYGEPLTLDPGLKDEEFEQERLRIEGLLKELDARADQYFDGL